VVVAVGEGIENSSEGSVGVGVDVFLGVEVSVDVKSISTRTLVSFGVGDAVIEAVGEEVRVGGSCVDADSVGVIS